MSNADYGIRVVLLFPETVWGTEDTKSHLLSRDLSIYEDLSCNLLRAAH